ncbi:uncharacterized protein [Clytia hemisphaerica]|uniref:Uncharacterized protein n=1 Tax=Clytia hemisphaerica TaxID=252671 RepID=A0A7M5XK94_9CNID
MIAALPSTYHGQNKPKKNQNGGKQKIRLDHPDLGKGGSQKAYYWYQMTGKNKHVVPTAKDEIKPTEKKRNSLVIKTRKIQVQPSSKSENTPDGNISTKSINNDEEAMKRVDDLEAEKTSLVELLQVLPSTSSCKIPERIKTPIQSSPEVNLPSTEPKKIVAFLPRVIEVQPYSNENDDIQNSDNVQFSDDIESLDSDRIDDECLKRNNIEIKEFLFDCNKTDDSRQDPPGYIPKYKPYVPMSYDIYPYK